MLRQDKVWQLMMKKSMTIIQYIFSYIYRPDTELYVVYNLGYVEQKIAVYATVEHEVKYKNTPS